MFIILKEAAQEEIVVSRSEFQFVEFSGVPMEKTRDWCAHIWKWLINPVYSKPSPSNTIMRGVRFSSFGCLILHGIICFATL
jgi:hypothetical protein